MKRKILILAIMIVALMSIFVISASAAVTGSTSNEYGDVTIVEGMESKNKYNDTDSKAVLVNADGTFTTYPAYYIYNGSTGTGMGIDLSLLNEKTGENYVKASLIRLEVFENARLDRTFEGCSGLIEVDLPDSVYFHYGSFSGCSSLAEIEIPSAATQIPASCFDGCMSLTKIVMPDTVTSIGNRAIANTNSLIEVVLPSNYTGILPHDFRKFDNYKPSTSCTYVVPKTCTGIYSIYSINNCNVSKIIFTGSETDAFITDLTAKNKNFLSLVEYKNHCDVYFDGVHYIKDSDDCTEDGDCDRCGLEDIVKGFAGHVFKETLVYENGFAQSGVYNKVCTNIATCTCQNITEGDATIAAPIFEARAENGYSTNGEGIAFGGYTVNVSALNTFNTINGTTPLHFGIIVVNPKYLGDTFMNGGKVNATAGELLVEMDDVQYSDIKIMLDGFTGKAAELELVISLYAYTDTSDVEFIQSEHTACAESKVTKEDATLYTVTLNSVENKPCTSLDALPEYKKDEE